MAKISSHRSRASHNPTKLGSDFKQKLSDSRLLLGGTIFSLLHPSLVKIYYHAGFDFIYLDREHNFFNGEEITSFVQCARDNGLPVISKIGELNRGEVARLLEAGVTGIQLPRTESREQLLTLMDYMKFPPRGTRAGAPIFGNVDYWPPADDEAWLRQADASLAVVAHIETVKGYEAIEEIVSTPGLDMLYVGPYDFSISFGHAGDYNHPAVREPMQRILELCRKHHVAFGTTPSDIDTGIDWAQQGCQFFELIDELSILRNGALNAVTAFDGMRNNK